MGTYKKTIFLKNQESSNKGMAILTLERKTGGIFCTFKSYDIGHHKSLILGLKSKELVIKQNIMQDSNLYNFLLNDKIDLDNSLSCVLLSAEGDNLTPLLWGSEKSENYKTQIVSSLKENINRLNTNNYTKKAVTNHSTNPSPNPETADIPNLYESKSGDIENTPEHPEEVTPADNLDTPAIAPFQQSKSEPINDYAQISMDEETLNSETAHVASMASLFQSDDTEINDIINKEMPPLNTGKQEHKFYNLIAEQLEELFDRYPRESNLENLVDNSRWVKINYEDNDKYYVVGVIYLNNEIRYICYGVPGNYYTEPPRELKDYSQWLPTDTREPYDNGYWVMYQDSDTGENVIIN